MFVPRKHVRSQGETAKIPCDPAAVAMGFGINLGAGCWRLQAGDSADFPRSLGFIAGVFDLARPCSTVCLGAKGAKGSTPSLAQKIGNPPGPCGKQQILKICPDLPGDVHYFKIFRD